MIKLVFHNGQLTLPSEVLPEGGKPFPHHFLSTPADNLIELCGRTCYDSSKLEKTRNSQDYHKHIQEVNHGSVQESFNLTVEFPNISREITDFFLFTCLNRPGVSVCIPSGLPRITANIRAIREWEQHHNDVCDINVQRMVGSAMQYFARQLAPMATADLGTIENQIPESRLVSANNPNEIWLSFYIYDISRGLTHELVRHKWRTAISQRSTRYVDESESNWSYHPLLTKYEDELIKLRYISYEKALQTDLQNPWCLESISKGTYNLVVDKLQELLIRDGIDKFSARKQSRGAARGLLGNALSTELIWSASLSAVKNVIDQRAKEAADGEIRLFANQLFDIVSSLYPQMFEGYKKYKSSDGIGYELR